MIMIRKLFLAVLIKFTSEGGKFMMAMFFAQRVILGKASFDSEDPNNGIPPALRQQVAEILIESGLDYLVPDEYKK